MEATELRPLTLGELLDRTFRLYRNHFWLFVGIMAIPSAFSVPFTVVTLSMQGSSIIPGRPIPSFPAGTLILVLVFWLIFAAVYPMAIGATTFAVSETYLGQTPTMGGSYGKVRGKIWRIIGVVVLAWLRAFGMFLLMGLGLAAVVGAGFGAMTVLSPTGASRIIFGVIVGLITVAAYVAWFVLGLVWALRYAVCIPTLLLEGLGIRAALRRSVQLTSGRRWQLLVAIMVCTAIAYVGVIVFQGPLFAMMMFSASTGHFPQWISYSLAVSGAIGGAITGPILLIVLVLCYYDTRIRKEAFDLQMMMSALDQPGAGPGAPTPA